MLSKARQADTYRRMRKATRGKWAAHAPATNCLWLSYLADTLLARKRVPLDAATKRDLRAFRYAAWSYDCLLRAGDVHAAWKRIYNVYMICVLRGGMCMLLGKVCIMYLCECTSAWSKRCE